MKQNKEIKISVSTNPPPVEELLDYIKVLDKTNADYIHCDVMDGKFVVAKTFNHKEVEQINNLTEKTLDVHLMVKHPYCKIKKYAKAGADIITVHYESFKCKKKLIRCLKKIYGLGVKAGLSFSPKTDVSDILPFVPYAQNILVMSVVPGKSGQKFIEESYDKVKAVSLFLKENGLDDVTIEIDGGVNKDNMLKLSKLGVDIFVLGNYIYSSQDVKKTIDDLKGLK